MSIILNQDIYSILNDKTYSILNNSLYKIFNKKIDKINKYIKKLYMLNCKWLE